MRPLDCTIYKSSREQELYLYVEKDSDLSQVPEELMQRLGKIQEVMTLALTPEKRLARVKSASVLKDIQDKGYFLQLPPDIHGHVTWGG